MVLITGTSKIKGMLDLSGIGIQLKSGDKYPITDDQFNDHTVQIAVQMGLITHVAQATTNYGTSRIQLRNLHDKAISLNALTAPVNPGAIFTLPEEEMNTPGIQGALAKGMLEVVSRVQPQPLIEEATIQIDDVFADDTDVSHADDSVPMDMFETNEEANKPVVIDSVIDTPNPDPIEPKDIPDPKKKSVVWNPNKERLAHTQTHMDSVTAHKTSKTTQKEKSVDVSEISFVDEELDEQRRQSHPILKDGGPPNNNNEIEFI